ncbi:hypothetical protein CLV43_110252 [Umezawaea tangerina]|uniref:Uncharacterized protein n=1 Tax=Umezawaea tangerina TaxID=84725 RepID=A0A2T0SVL7_9PSEU|nr:hypothetical protein CLV43_110252 [Umezawaea tangerina]
MPVRTPAVYGLATAALSAAVAVEAGAPSPVLGGAPHGGRRTTAGPAHLVAARDPVPRQVRRAVGTALAALASPVVHGGGG